jgi:hypothetical protein
MEALRIFLLCSVPNEIWSKQQAEFIDSLFDNAKNFSLTPEKYLKTIRR